MIEKDLFSFDFDSIQITSDIITVKELDEAENLKRYIVFGHGSPDDISFLTSGMSNSVSTSNGFFSIVTLPENKITSLESAGLHVMEDFPLSFHSKYTEYNPHSKISEIGNLANSKDVHELYNVTGNNLSLIHI